MTWPMSGSTGHAHGSGQDQLRRRQLARNRKAPAPHHRAAQRVRLDMERIRDERHRVRRPNRACAIHAAHGSCGRQLRGDHLARGVHAVQLDCLIATQHGDPLIGRRSLKVAP